MAYDKKIVFPLILLEIEEGASLRSILRRNEMPTQKTFFDWLLIDEDKVKQYAYACEKRADAKFDSIEQDYLEEPQRDPLTGKIDAGWVQLQRLKIDSKKWELGKMNPKKYGDKIQQEHSGEVTTNIISLGNGIAPNETN